RLLSMREESASDGASMAKRVHDRASGASCKARVVAFSCFRPVPSCYRWQIGATRATPLARISRLHPTAYEKHETPGCSRPPVFPLLFTGKNRAAGGRLRTLPQAARITTSRGVGGGAVEGLIPHGVVATFQKPGTRGRARASRLRAA